MTDLRSIKPEVYLLRDSIDGIPVDGVYVMAEVRDVPDPDFCRSASKYITSKLNEGGPQSREHATRIALGQLTCLGIEERNITILYGYKDSIPFPGNML